MAPAPPASLLHPLTSVTDPLAWSDVFATDQPVEIDLGCGDGSFLVEYARRHPERNFLGVERLLGRLRKLDRRGRKLGLQNLRGLRVEFGYFVRHLLPPGSVAAFHVYFPDPWPKKRHHKNRTVNPDFPALVRRILQPGGVIHLRTDHAEYFAQMLEVFDGAAGFQAVATPGELSEVLTDFEQGFRAQGLATHSAAYRKAD